MVSNNLSTNLKLEQKLTPQMLQSLKLLQANHLQLTTLIHQELEINPLLEINETEILEIPSFDNEYESKDLNNEAIEKKSKEEIDWESFFNDESLPKPKKKIINSNTIPFDNLASDLNLNDHLLKQLQMVKTTSAIKKLVEYLIDLIDEGGYLRFQELSKIPLIKEETVYEKKQIQSILFGQLHQAESTLNVREAFHILTHFDPAGIGAKDLKECLLLQLYRLKGNFSLEIKIIEDHLDLLESLKISILATKLKTSIEEIKIAIKNIGKLNPRPARIYDNQITLAVIPEISIQIINDKITISYNNNIIPSLNISTRYTDLIKKDSQADQKTKKFIKQKLNSATSFIFSIEQRKSTILKIAECLVKKQPNFFLKGPQYLHPMTLENVATDIEMHISTVSRVINEKHIQTPYGCYPLKSFFSSKIINEQGCSISSTRIKSSLKEIIQKENNTKPLSDQKIADLLQIINMKVARRTVTKYREQLKILPARMRKKI